MPESNRPPEPERLRHLLEENGARGEALDRFDRMTSRRGFLSSVGKGAALAGLGVLGAGPDAAVRGTLRAAGLIPGAWAAGDGLAQAGDDRPLRGALQRRVPPPSAR